MTEQETADRVIEAGLLLQKCARDARRLGMEVSINWYGDDLSVKVYREQVTELASMPKGKKK
jgi:hypothetical protein